MLASSLKKDDLISVYCEEFQKDMDGKIVEFRHHMQQAYVHFLKQDKRLDRWVDVSLLKAPNDPNALHEEDHVMSRNQRRMLDDSEDDEDDINGEFAQFEKIHKEVTKIRNIDRITIGNYTVKTWYFSPYPYPYFKMDHLYICEQCFAYFSSQKELDDHMAELDEKCPPGREIYREGNLSVFELKGWKQKIPCQCLCLLSKLFLDHKTLFYDVEGFIFYILCECDEKGAHIAAYFSKEVNSSEGNILACITTLPPYQKKGYGNFLISLAYEIAKRQRRSGGPERPLSDLGKIAFHSYWRDTLLELLKEKGETINSLEDLVTMTAIDRNDIIDTLKEAGLVTKVKGDYDLNLNKETLREACSCIEFSKHKRTVDPRFLIWLPGDDK